ncbi:hypothetical protein ACFY97_18780 [Streptomyces klenkii]|uniref:hypothetical protein n=1 Tax=Streptomyces klenkii TaxID=1420899 RepID=UPI0036EE22CF
MAFEDYTAAELAHVLESIKYRSPEDMATLSMLSERTFGWARRYPQLGMVQDRFSRAAAAQWPRSRSDQTWREVVAASQALAASMRRLGNIRLALCKERAGWGTCNLTLDEEGQCSQHQ